MVSHGLCVPEYCKKGYRMIVVYGKEVKVSFHKLSAILKSDLRKQ